MTSERAWRRAAALEAAAALPWTPQVTAWTAQRTATRVLAVAEIFDAWLAIPPDAVASFTITADVPVDRPTQEGPGMSLTFPDTQETTLHVTAITDAEGVTVTDTFTWTVDDATILTLTPAADTLSCMAVPGTAQGSATVTATASDGVARTFAVDVTAGPTAAFEITADAPVDRPAPAAPAPAAGA